MALAGLLGVALSGCSSGPDLRRVVEVTPTSRAIVRYSQPKRELQQTLAFDGNLTAREFYNSPEADRYAKLLSKEQMQVLLDALGAEGMFESARAQAAPSAFSTLSVELDGRRWIWSGTASTPEEEAARYNRAFPKFLNIWNGTSSFHSGAGQNSVLEEHEQNVQRYRQDLERAKSGDLQIGGERGSSSTRGGGR